MKKIITLSMLLAAAVHVNAQRLALYAGGGFVKDFMNMTRVGPNNGSSYSRIQYEGGSGAYLELLAATTFKNRIEIMAGARAMALGIKHNYAYGYSNGGNSFLMPQVGIGYNRNAKLSIRAGMLAGRYNPPDMIVIEGNNIKKEFLLDPSITLTPYASIGYKNIMVNTSLIYGVSKMIENTSNSHATILTLGVIYRIPIIK